MCVFLWNILALMLMFYDCSQCDFANLGHAQLVDVDVNINLSTAEPVAGLLKAASKC